MGGAVGGEVERRLENEDYFLPGCLGNKKLKRLRYQL